jgi:osmotically-inducible protein OsmY
MSKNSRIKSDILEQLIWDSRILSSNIEVTVKNEGEVVLKGNIPTLKEKKAAEKDAFLIPGVTSVENQIKVRYPESRIIPSDSELKQRLHTLLKLHYAIDLSGIQVQVSNGHVTLLGSVNAYWKKEETAEIVSALGGVLEVDNHLAVVPSEDVLDETIAREIERALKRNSGVNAEAITVKVENGKVTLSGTVKDHAASESARHTASYTAGVKEVTNTLRFEKL